MKILAVDTSCDESCAAVFDVAQWKLLSDVVHSHVASMEVFGGVVPEIASREHLKSLPLVVNEALNRASVTLDQIDWFAVTNRPGLVGALLVGISYVKALAFAASKPFSVMNHLEAHLYSPLLITAETGKSGPKFPWLALVVSGGHTELFHVEEFGKHRWLGGTLDDAAGEAFDKVGKLLGLDYPAGPRLDRWVREGGAAAWETKYSLPRASTARFHFSYSGLKTAVSNSLHREGPMSDSQKLSFASCAQEAILDPLVDQLRLGRLEFPESVPVITGGVACNSRLRAKLPNAYFPEPRHCTDNAAMIALLAALYAKAGRLIPSGWNATAAPTAGEI